MSMKKVIATDLDGTLFYPTRKIRMISSRNSRFLREYINNGGRVIIVSGRNYPYAEKVIKKIGSPMDIVCCNGAYLKINDRIIRQAYLPKDRLKNILEEIRAKFAVQGMALMSDDQSLVLSYRGISWLKKLGYRLYYLFQGIYAEKYLFGDDEFDLEIIKGKVLKLMLYFGLTKKAKDIALEVNKYIRNQYGTEIESAWSGAFIEITSLGSNKANGLMTMCQELGVDVSDMAVVGDSGNDISMFKAFYENSYCMSHAHEKVKKQAKHVIQQFHNLEKYIYEGESKNE